MSRSSIPPVVVAGALLLSALALFLYGEILTYGLTVADSSHLILSARVESIADLLHVLTTPYLERPNLGYFRPATTLIFSLLHRIFGLDATGYHLFNLLAYTGVALVLYRLIARLEKREATGLIAAALFLMHPINIQVVPGLTLGQEIYVTLFGLLSLYGFLRWSDGDGEGSLPWYLLSIGGFLLAAAVKESGLMLLVLLPSMLILRESKGDAGRCRRTLKDIGAAMAPFLGAGLLYGVYWGGVTGLVPFLEGSGPWRYPIFLGDPLLTLRHVAGGLSRQGLYYTGSLLHPTIRGVETLLGTIPFFDIVLLRNLAVWILLLTLILLTIDWRSTVCTVPSEGRRQPTSLGIGLRTFGIVLGAICLLALILFPLYEPALQTLVENAYRGQGPEWLQAMMESRNRVPLSKYGRKAALAPIAFSILGGLVALLAVTAGRYGFPTFAPRRLLYGVWVALPFLFHGFVQVFHFRNGYFGVPALCALAATYLDGGWKPGLPVRSLRTHPLLGVQTAGKVLAFLVALSILLAAPFGNGLEEWDRIQTRHQRFLRVLEGGLKPLPPESTVRVQNVPNWKTDHPDAPGLPNFAGRGSSTPRVPPWIALRFPDRNFTVIPGRYYRWMDQRCSCDFTLEIGTRGSHFFELRVDSEETLPPET